MELGKRFCLRVLRLHKNDDVKVTLLMTGSILRNQSNEALVPFLSVKIIQLSYGELKTKNRDSFEMYLIFFDEKEENSLKKPHFFKISSFTQIRFT